MRRAATVWIAGTIIVIGMTSNALHGMRQKKPTRQVPFGVASKELSCDAALQSLRDNRYRSDDERFAVALRWTSCALAYRNRTKPSEAVVVSVTMDADRKVLFNTIRLSDAQKVRDACTKMADAYTLQGAVSGNAVELIGAGGVHYSCDAYMRAISRNDPLLVVFPAMVPGTQLTRDAIHGVLTNAQVMVKFAHDNPGQAAALGTFELQAQTLKTIGDRLGGDAGRYLGDAGDAVHNAGKALADGAQKVLDWIKGDG